MSLSGGEIRLEVDDEMAVYPVTIDPHFTQQAKLLAGDGQADVALPKPKCSRKSDCEQWLAPLMTSTRWRLPSDVNQTVAPIASRGLFAPPISFTESQCPASFVTLRNTVGVSSHDKRHRIAELRHTAGKDGGCATQCDLKVRCQRLMTERRQSLKPSGNQIYVQ